MKVGIPEEIKSDKYWVAMLPGGALELTQAGHTILIETGPGHGSGIAVLACRDTGATIVSDAAEIWAEADLIVQVKEPQPPEWPRLRFGQVVFTYFHFAADEALTRAIIDSGITAIAYAFCNVTTRYLLQLANHGWHEVAAADLGVAMGVNIDRGRVANQAVTSTFGLPCATLGARQESVNVPIRAT